jgi:hypothetical protein
VGDQVYFSNDIKFTWLCLDSSTPNYLLNYIHSNFCAFDTFISTQTTVLMGNAFLLNNMPRFLQTQPFYSSNLEKIAKGCFTLHKFSSNDDQAL